MKKKFTDDQIITILKEAQQGELSTEEVCRKHGCSTASFYSWKKKFGDTSSDQAKLLRRLQRENERLVMLQEFLPNLARPFRGSGKLEEYYGKATQNLVT